MPVSKEMAEINGKMNRFDADSPDSDDRTTFADKTGDIADMPRKVNAGGAYESEGIPCYDKTDVSGELTRFDKADVSGELTRFDKADVSGELTHFDKAGGSGELTHFDETDVSGELIRFDKADVSGELTHFDKAGNAVMVDVSGKAETRRTAVASGCICVSRAVMEAVRNGTASKGDVLGVARIAGIMAAKNTSGLIPLCHPLPISKVSVDFELIETQTGGKIRAACTVSVTGRTGVEMEALTGTSMALLTVYDMCKSIDKRMEITDVHLEQKSGGKSGDFMF